MDVTKDSPIVCLKKASFLPEQQAVGRKQRQRSALRKARLLPTNCLKWYSYLWQPKFHGEHVMSPRHRFLAAIVRGKVDRPSTMQQAMHQLWLLLPGKAAALLGLLPKESELSPGATSALVA